MTKRLFRGNATFALNNVRVLLLIVALIVALCTFRNHRVCILCLPIHPTKHRLDSASIQEVKGA